ncbi:hypothetical protein GJ496_010710 [Pomphorhynchus laevis]|nr:hypothetical protein GJ496_010710 [Pomphorhynchus laevis]
MRIPREARSSLSSTFEVVLHNVNNAPSDQAKRNLKADGGTSLSTRLKQASSAFSLTDSTLQCDLGSEGLPYKPSRSLTNITIDNRSLILEL